MCNRVQSCAIVCSHMGVVIAVLCHDRRKAQVPATQTLGGPQPGPRSRDAGLRSHPAERRKRLALG